MTSASTAHKRGAEYEHAVAEILSGMGYSVSTHESASQHDCDLVVNSLTIEVKGSKLHGYNSRHYFGYQFLLRRSTSTSDLTAPIVILYCKPEEEIAIELQQSRLFVVPLNQLIGVRSITIPNRSPKAYHGKWSKFYMRFDLLFEAINQNTLAHLKNPNENAEEQ